MEFCPKCDSRLIYKRKENGKGTFLSCSRCDYNKSTQAQRKTPKVSSNESQESIVVIGAKEKKLQTLPTATIECPKCENKQAYTWQVQTRGADESSTQFFRCTRCNYTFREYS